MNKKTVLTFLFAAALSVALAGCAQGGATAGASASSAADDTAASAQASSAAGEAPAASGMASLQIVNVDDAGKAQVMVNKSYAYADDCTVVNLLDAAVKAGDLSAYQLNEYGFIQSFTFTDGTTVENADDFSTYWAQYENGVYYAGQDTLITEAIVDNVAYQFGLETYVEGEEGVPTDWSALDAPTESDAMAGPDLAQAA